MKTQAIAGAKTGRGVQGPTMFVKANLNRVVFILAVFGLATQGVLAKHSSENVRSLTISPAGPATPGNPSPGSTSSPGPVTSSSSVTLSWNGSSGATTYGVGVRDMGTNVLVVDTNASGTSYTA